MHGFGLNSDRLVSQGSVVSWVDCGGECDEWLRLRGFAYPAIIYLFIFIILPHTINYKQNKSDNK